MTPEFKKAVDDTVAKLKAMSPEEFAAELKKSEDSDMLPFLQEHIQATAYKNIQETKMKAFLIYLEVLTNLMLMFAIFPMMISSGDYVIFGFGILLFLTWGFYIYHRFMHFALNPQPKGKKK
jgi:hypothetical protein